MPPLLLLAGAWLLLLCVHAQIDGFDQGPFSVQQFDMGTIKDPLPQFAPYHITVHYPTTCNSQCGEFIATGAPVLLFATGFAGTLNTAYYNVVLSNIARHGIVVVAVDQDLTGFQLTLDMQRFGVQLNKVLSWIKDTESTGLLAKLRNPGGGKPRFTMSQGLFQGGSKIFYGGHSSGAHIVLQNVVDVVKRNGACPPDVAGFVLLSPLDGQDPLGFGGIFALSPYNNARFWFTSPGLIVAGDLDKASGTAVQGMPCVPNERGNLHFYDGWPGFMQYIEAAGMGTLDVLDESVTTSYDSFCASSNQTSQANDRIRYRTMVRGAVVSFIQGIVTAKTNYMDKLKNEADLNFPTTINKRTAESGVIGCQYFPVTRIFTEEQETGLVLFAITFAISFTCGLCYIFQKMDESTTHRYHEKGELEEMGIGGGGSMKSFAPQMEPSYTQSQVFSAPQSSQFGSRQVSINV